MRAKYFCTYCKQPSESLKDPKNGKDKIRAFQSGWVARYLKCGHLTAVTTPPITEPPTAVVQ
ncbi:MAG TPA: hypothetical protein VFW94_23625 [Candidatus Acidoferrales bacterium]|nr:hypothetical protein [Candidatus Acidoferrales bacterium]